MARPAVRLDQETYDELGKLAHEDYRTLTAYVNIVLKNHIADQRKETA